MYFFVYLIHPFQTFRVGSVLIVASYIFLFLLDKTHIYIMRKHLDTKRKIQSITFHVFPTLSNVQIFPDAWITKTHSCHQKLDTYFPFPSKCSNFMQPQNSLLCSLNMRLQIFGVFFNIFMAMVISQLVEDKS